MTAIDYYLVLADLRRKRKALDAVLVVVEEIAAEQRAKQDLEQPVCVVDISRCPTLIELVKQVAT